VIFGDPCGISLMILGGLWDVLVSERVLQFLNHGEIFE